MEATSLEFFPRSIRRPPYPPPVASSAFGLVRLVLYHWSFTDGVISPLKAFTAVHSQHHLAPLPAHVHDLTLDYRGI